MTSRSRSVPPVPPNTRVTRSSQAATSSSTLLAVHHTRTTVPPGGGSTPAPHAAHLAAQAEALAKMTLEMNIRSVSKQAARLEQDLKALVQSTAHDAAFRAHHETRLQDMWKEILAVKAHAAQERETKDMADEACRQEMSRVMDAMRGEIAGVREMVGGLSATVAELPTAEQLQNALSQSTEGDAARHGHETQDIDSQSQTLSQPSTPAIPSIRTRIQDAVKSTRRWNRDHKTTRLTDAVFCARYLQQQSKRDARMAVFLQRAIQRRVQARFPGRPLRPRSLDEFCQLVAWADVKAVVEGVLLRDTTDVTEALQAAEEQGK